MKKITLESKYYPQKILNPVSAQNQPYPSSSYYPYPNPTNTFRLNPLVLPSLKTMDIDNLQDVFGKGFQDMNQQKIGEKISNEKMFKENEEIKEIKAAIEYAKLNQARAKQIQQNQYKRIQNLIKDTKEDEEVLKKLELDKQRAIEENEQKKMERIKAKKLLQQQMKEKEKLKQEAEKEYQKDLQDIKKIMDSIHQEDINYKNEDERKKNIAKQYMYNAYKEKEERKRREMEEEKLQRERERQHQENVDKRESDLNDKKAQIQQEKDKIFNKLCQEEAKRQAEKDYWENVRNDLYTEQENLRAKNEEKAEKEKLLRQKEEMQQSALEQMKRKEDIRKREKEEENELQRRMIEKFKEDEKHEMDNILKKKQQEQKMKQEIEKQWQYKLQQYQEQKKAEIDLLNKKKLDEENKKYLVEQEKKRLLQENESLLKNYYPTGYKKAINSINSNLQKPKGENLRNDIIYNNIFGNTNPNKPSAYPKYGKIKNYVYDKGIQDIHHNINMDNYPLYNATANNDYDSYPSVEEYKKMMVKNGQINLAYAGGGDVTGIPMRGQMPLYANNEFNRKWLLNDEGNKTMYNPKVNKESLTNSNSYKNLNNSTGFKYNDKSYLYNEKNNNEGDINRTFYRRQKSFSEFNRNLTMRSTNPNGIYSPQNYQQTIKQKVAV